VPEQADRVFWENKTDSASLAVMDKIAALLKDGSVEPRLTYNKHHIALGTTGYNFGWLHPRKTPGHCHVEFRAGAETRDTALSTLQDGGIDAFARGANNVTFSVTSKALSEHEALIRDALKHAEEASRA
jgi:hypothetical protein